MNFKRWVGGLVAVLFIGAIGLELWTFSEVLLPEADTSSTPAKQNSGTAATEFKHGPVTLDYPVLYVRARGDRWTFHGTLRANNESNRAVHLTITGVRMQSGDEYTLTEPLILEAGGEQTIQFSVEVDPGDSPESLRIKIPENTSQPVRWLSLPSVTVRSE